MVTLYDFGLDASACHSIYDLGCEGAIPIQVVGDTLQNILQRNGIDRLRFLKLDCQGGEYEIIPNTPFDILEKVDYIAMEVHSMIAKHRCVLGTIPEYEVKKEKLYQHLSKTHSLIVGNAKDDSIQLWQNKRFGGGNEQ